MSLPGFDYRAPVTIEEAVALRLELGADALIMAGGLAVVVLLRERLARPAVVVSLSDIPELQAVAVNGGLRIGATATHAALARSKTARSIAPLLCEACGHVGSPAIRNMGTLGGSVCHGDGASDPAPALLALDAEAIIAGPRGERRLPLVKFFLGALTTALNGDEILVALHVPRPAAGTQFRFIKYTATSAEAFSTVTVAVSITRDGAGVCSNARIGLGSVAPTPLRARAAEDLLRGNKLTREIIAAAAAAAAACTNPSSSAQGSAEYRRDMTEVWVRRLLAEMPA
ncbi:MAG: xanthine dehydrogenase family protein subunit M [Betaproteobacteria bacterium]|nr:xanthine dehydrogenase family protein subunit M [Betaproteobacteria bacterium]